MSLGNHIVHGSLGAACGLRMGSLVSPVVRLLQRRRRIGRTAVLVSLMSRWGKWMAADAAAARGGTATDSTDACSHRQQGLSTYLESEIRCSIPIIAL